MNAGTIRARDKTPPAGYDASVDDVTRIGQRSPSEERAIKEICLLVRASLFSWLETGHDVAELGEPADVAALLLSLLPEPA